MTMTLFSQNVGSRACGGCTLCCRLVPVAEIGKPAGQRCQYQKAHGCGIYTHAPLSCRAWSCGWLVDPDARNLRRPDRTRYVIDAVPDFVTARPDDGSPERQLAVVQVWCDPKEPHAHRDPALRDYLEAKGLLALVRYNSEDGFVLVPPQISGTGQWHEHAAIKGAEHTGREIDAVLTSHFAATTVSE